MYVCGSISCVSYPYLYDWVEHVDVLMRNGSLQLHVGPTPDSEGGSRSVLRDSQLIAYETMLKLVNSKIEDMMSPQEQIVWMAAEAPMVRVTVPVTGYLRVEV